MPGKICVICGQDCSDKPRVKDPQGRYACRACAEAQAHGTSAAADAPAASNDDCDILVGLSDSLPSDEPSAGGQGGLNAACLNCGVTMPAGAAVCMRCGYNATTGKVMAPKVKAESGAGAAGTARKAGGFVAAPVLWIIGGCVGGGIGAAIWAAIAYFTGYEVGIVAWGVGLLAGLGVVVGARGQGNVYSGCVAVIIAFLSIAAGKYAAVSLYYDNLADEIGNVTTDEITEEDVLQHMVDEIALDWIDNGRSIEWPTIGMTIDEATWPHDYPRDLRDATTKRFETMSEVQVEQYKQDMIDSWQTGLSVGQDTYVEEDFWATWGLFDVLWVFLAIASAYRVGAAESD